MLPRSALLPLLLLGACSGRSRTSRPLGAEDAKGWRIEATAVRTHEHVEGGLSPSRDEWWVVVEVSAHKQDTHTRLGTLWQALGDSEQTSGHWYEHMTLQHCGDGERVLMRLRVPRAPPERPIDARWNLLVAAPSTLAVEANAVAGDACTDALAATPSVDAWLAAALQRPVDVHPTGHIGGAVLGQPAVPTDRASKLARGASAFVFAAREGHHAAAAIDFALDRLPAYGELVQWHPGRDAYGPFDVLQPERDRLLLAVRSDPALRRHVLDRAPPEAGPDVVRWYEALRAAARSMP